jgi:glucose-6-phosphate 1-dehydrogenase
VTSTELAENPLVEGLERLPVRPTTLVIFGATGDLARRKLLPAVYNLAHERGLPERFRLLGVSRGDMSEDAYRELARESIRSFSRRPPDEDVLDVLLKSVGYVSGRFDDVATYGRVAAMCQAFDDQAETPLNRCFYLSTGPAFFPVIIEALGNRGLDRRHGADVRVVVEKPIGIDLAEARELNRRTLAVFRERQIFRIDHYLGKETVQNILALRFVNRIFEPVWNSNYIDHIQITAAEDVGVGSRAGYYDHAGALRDLVQNHLLQLLSLICMEPPVRFSSDEVRDEKVKILRAIEPPDPEHVNAVTVRARYAGGTVGGQEVPAYTDEPGVAPASRTETFAALRLGVSNWRWLGVPIYLRTGKRLARKTTEIAIRLKQAPDLGFIQNAPAGVLANTLVLKVQPTEGVSLSLGAKIPGTRMSIRPVNMEFLYGSSFLSESPEAYERLILDAMRGDGTLFTRDDEVEAQWSIIDPILEGWAHESQPLMTYPAGSQGPEEAERLLNGERIWRAI